MIKRYCGHTIECGCSPIIPTAQEFCLQYNIKAEEMQSILSYVMIEFAKLHVWAALQNAADNAMCKDEGIINGEDEWSEHYLIDKNSILNAYPKKLII